MRGVNKVILIGNLGKDPELRSTATGMAVASFSLATTESRTDKNGQKQETTEWHNIVAWGKLAEIVNLYLKKGRSAYIEGRITYRSWDDREGNKKYKTEIVASNVQFLGGGPGQGGSPDKGAHTDNDMPAMPADMNQAPEVAEDNLPF